MQTFLNLPESIEEAITNILAQNSNPFETSTAEKLHDRYLNREKGKNDTFLNGFADALAYLTMRLPATYTQVAATLLSIQEQLPSWKPQTLLDIGAGPGTGAFAANTIWPSLQSATCVDMNNDLINLGKKISTDAQLSTEIVWKHADIREGITENETYDVVLLANVLNELSKFDSEELIQKAYKLCKGVLIIVEPGTSFGNTLVQSVAKRMSDSGILLAPYLNNSFIKDKDYWVHFSQKFIRPDFQRQVRQQMRESSLMASDWEETKFCYVAISKIKPENHFWGRCIGPVNKQKGFLEVPILTEGNISQVKVMKRHKEQYTFAKNLKWGQLIPREENLIFPRELS